MRMMNSMEEWRDIPGLEGRYQVSSEGRVRTVSRECNAGWHKTRIVVERIRKFEIHYSGYLKLAVREGLRFRKYFVHRLVAYAFLPNPENLAYVNHKDRDRSNNRLENLEWISEAGNQHHWREDERKKKVVAVVEDEEIKPEDIPF